MSNDPASNMKQDLQHTVDSIAEKRAKEIRHADVITHDPEGQRVKALISAALWDLYEFLFPKDDGITTHVTTQRDAPFVVHGLKETAVPALTLPAAQPVYVGVCGVCGEVHDPRRHYDHAAQAPKQKKHREKK